MTVLVGLIVAALLLRIAYIHGVMAERVRATDAMLRAIPKRADVWPDARARYWWMFGHRTAFEAVAGPLGDTPLEAAGWAAEEQA